MSQQPFDIIIIGAGPAGLFTALCAAAPARRILILEKQPSAGRKLLLTGSGQCNFTNARPIAEFLSCYGEHGRFLKPALFHFTNQDIMAFFAAQGVASTIIPRTGKVFPHSLRSQDILSVLLAQCRERGVQFHCGQGVKAVEPLPGQGFQVEASQETYTSQSVVIATGGSSYPATGSTGDGFGLAAGMGHHITPLRPGLAPFFIKNFTLSGLSGTSFQNLAVTLWRNHRKIKTLFGDLVITHHGLSGPVIHHLCRYALAEDDLTLAFCGADAPDAYIREALADMDQHGKIKVAAWIRQQAPTQALADHILSQAGVAAQSPLAQLSREQRRNLLQLLTAFPLTLQAIGDFSQAMVTCGGVCLDEVNAKTMESRLVPGLYFVGEVLDIDGDTGGYDLQAAWSTAALAAKHLVLEK